MSEQEKRALPTGRPALPVLHRGFVPSAAARPARRAALLFRCEGPLHLAAILQLTEPIARFAADGAERTVLFLDLAAGGTRLSCGLTAAGLERLACLPRGGSFRIARAAAVPAMARLTTLVGAHHLGLGEPLTLDPHAWFNQLLLAAGVLATRASHVVIESPAETSAPALSEEIALVRRLAARLASLPGGCAFPVPIASAFDGIAGLDGRGPMGSTEAGTLYLADSEDTVVRKLRRARTDGAACLDPEQPVSPAVRNLILLLHAVSGEPAVEIVDRFAGKGYGRLKETLADAINAYLAPMRARRDALLAAGADVARELQRGSAKLEADAGEVAEALARTVTAAA